MEWLNFRHLYAFWSVCRYGGFQKASKKILVSQSAISDQVSQLEDYLEVKLLERTTRSFQITPEGADLLNYADEIFQKSSEINSLFSNKVTSGTSQLIRIGMVGGISRNFLFRMLIQNMNEDDQRRFHVIDGSYEELTQQLKAYEVDLIFGLEIPPKKDLLKVSYKKITSSPVCLAGKPDIIKKLKSKRKKTEPIPFFLFNHPFEGNPIEKVVEPRFGVQAETPITTDDISLLRFLANSGRGVAVVPEIGVQEDLNTGNLSRIVLDEIPTVDFYAIYLTKGFHQAAVQDFLI